MKLVHSPINQITKKNSNNNLNYLNANINNHNNHYRYNFEKIEEKKLFENFNLKNLSKLKSNIAFKLKLPKINSNKISNNLSININNNTKKTFTNDILLRSPDRTIKIRKRRGKSIFTNSIVDNALGTVSSSDYGVYNEDSFREDKHFMDLQQNPNNNYKTLNKKSNNNNSNNTNYKRKSNNNDILFNFEEEEEYHFQNILSERYEEDYLNRMNTFSSTSLNMENEEKNKVNVFNKVLNFEILNNNCKYTKHRRNHTNGNIKELNIDDLNINDSNMIRTINKEKFLYNKKFNIFSPRDLSMLNNNDKEVELMTYLNIPANFFSEKIKRKKEKNYEKTNSKNLNENLINNQSQNKNNNTFVKKEIIKRNSSSNANNIKKDNLHYNINENIENNKNSNQKNLKESPKSRKDSKRKNSKTKNEKSKNTFNKKIIRINTDVDNKSSLKSFLSPVNKSKIREKVMLTSNPAMINCGAQTIDAYNPNTCENNHEIKEKEETEVKQENLSENLPNNRNSSSNSNKYKKEKYQKLEKLKPIKENKKSKNQLKNIFIKYSKEIET